MNIIDTEQQQHLKKLREVTGVIWEEASHAYVARCKNSNLPAVAIPSDVLNQYYYYVPKNHYCKFSDEFAKAIVTFRDKHAWEAIPAIKYDLNGLPKLAFLKDFGARTYVFTFSLDGDIIIQHKSSISPFTMGQSLESFSVNTKMVFNDFLSTFKLRFDAKTPEKIGLGVAVAGDFWNTSFVMAGDTIIASANPKPINISYKGWLIEGHLGFSVVGSHQDSQGQSSATSVAKGSGYILDGLLILALFSPAAAVVGTAALVRGIRGAMLVGKAVR